jgi:hypothetical protein
LIAMGRDAAQLRWQEAATGCAGILNMLGKTGDADAQTTVRTWWVLCMGSRLMECRAAVSSWKEQAQQQGLPESLQPEHTRAAVALPAFEPLAKCVTLRSMEIGVEPSKLLDDIQGNRKQAQAEWIRAVDDVGPLKVSLQSELLPAARVEKLTWLQRRTAQADRAGALAPSPAAMDIDEARLCQVWLYGLATRLSKCKEAASTFAQGVGMADPNTPLQGYESSRWDPSSSKFMLMEACVHLQAARAGAKTDVAWRARKAT